MVDEANISTSGRKSVGEILLPHKKRVKSVQRSSRIRGYSMGKSTIPLAPDQWLTTTKSAPHLSNSLRFRIASSRSRAVA